jgi:hypothetical protein
VVLVSGLAFATWMFVAGAESAKVPAPRVETSETFTLGP